MAAATRSLATALWGARFASGLLPRSYTTNRDTTPEPRESRRTGLRRVGFLLLRRFMMAPSGSRRPGSAA
jgi:hypothetical protein